MKNMDKWSKFFRYVYTVSQFIQLMLVSVLFRSLSDWRLWIIVITTALMSESKYAIAAIKYVNYRHEREMEETK